MAFDVVVAPPTLYYAQADGTNFKDSAFLGAKLEKQTAFKNLISEFIKPKAGTPGRLECATRPWFPLWRVDLKSRPDAKGIAVIAPGGLNGSDEKNELSSKGDEASEFIDSWFFEPAVTIDSSGNASLGVGAGTVHRAHLVIMSSHGWLGGFAQGDFGQPKWFLVGKTAEQGRGFKGPVWVILTQCSTLNSATWASWTKILARSTPHVRGILGYEEVAPGASAAATINDKFVASLKAGKTFLEAWVANNLKNNWAAIVHKDALQDKLKDLPDIVQGKRPLSDVSTTETTFNYYGLLKNVDNGKKKEIYDKRPPFDLKLFASMAAIPGNGEGFSGRKRYEVKPSTLDDMWHAIVVADDANPPEYHVEVTAPSDMTSLTVEWIHIRPTKPRLKMNKIFKPAASTSSGAKVATKGAKSELTVVDLSPASTTCKVVFTSQTVASLSAMDGKGNDFLEPHHSYLYPRVTVKLASGSELKADFPTIGLSYYGPTQ